jgi:hypothetical protein
MGGIGGCSGRKARSGMMRRSFRFWQYPIECNYFSANLADHAAADRTLSFWPRSTLIWRHIRQIAGQRLVICLSDADYAALERKAADMQKSAVKLSGELLEAIISSDIYEAVLDDDK